MTSIAVSQFRSHLPSYLKKVRRGETIVILSRGREVALLVPPINKLKDTKKRLEQIRKKAFVGDVLSSIPVAWDVES